MLKRLITAQNFSPALGLFVSALSLYLLTLLPGVGGGDTAEFQRIAPTLGLAHSTGYPLYTLIGWLYSHSLPLGSMAWRMNALSALMAAGTVSFVFVMLRQLDVTRVIAWLSAALLGVSLTFWQQATHAEIYSFAMLLQASFCVSLLAWQGKKVPLWLVGLLAGLMLAHHRMSILLLPFAAVFVLIQRPRLRDVLQAIGVMLLPLLLYLYVPLRAEAWQNRWQLLGDYLLGSVGGDWFSLSRLWHDGWQRWWSIINGLIAPQFTWFGLIVAVTGSVVLWRKNRLFALFLLGSYVLILLFCAAYYVPDLDTFLLPAHLIQALLIGVALMQLLRWRWLTIGGLVLLFGWNLWHNLPVIQAANTKQSELIARERLAQPLQPNSLVIGDGWGIEGLRYLQTVEGMRPDLEFGFNPDAGYIHQQLARGRAVYLLNATPTLMLKHRRIVGMWQLSDEPLTISTPSVIDWNEGIKLTGYDLPNDQFQAGETILITLRWRIEPAVAQGYFRFVHIVDAQGTVWGQADNPVSDAYDLAIPTLKPDTPKGRYRVLIGWFDPATGQRLALNNGQDSYELGVLEVRSSTNLHK